ncbi:MAG: dTMP kinase [Alphaproteobacteria bacterium]|nr:MAG: dTMP kinase [Alphaproteobacteria bacterium]
MARPWFISIEGGEGVGKSTQARRLAAWLEEQDVSCLLTREPGGAPGAEDIRRLLVEGSPERWTPMAEALLHTAARVEHVEEAIGPALRAGRWVISDRFVDSTIVYQGIVQGLGVETVVRLHELALNGVYPDLTLILDLPAEVGLARARGRQQGRGEDRYERHGDSFHRRIEEGFREVARRWPKRCRLIDASGDPDAVAARIRFAVAPLLAGARKAP